jgi:hypothetical protein
MEMVIWSKNSPNLEVSEIAKYCHADELLEGATYSGKPGLE